MEKEQEEQNLSDENLAGLSLKNQKYFLFLVNRYQDKLKNYIRRLTNIREEDIEDLLQEIFIKVYVNLNDFDRDLRFSSWIYRIAHNQVISHHRKISVRPEGSAVSIDGSAALQLAADIDLNMNVDEAILKEEVAKVLRILDPSLREVLVLKFLEEKNYQEISDILKKPLGTVASLINRAKKEFAAEFSRQQSKT